MAKKTTQKNDAELSTEDNTVIGRACTNVRRVVIPAIADGAPTSAETKLILRAIEASTADVITYLQSMPNERLIDIGVLIEHVGKKIRFDADNRDRVKNGLKPREWK